MPAPDAAALRTPLEAIMREAGQIALDTSRREFKRWTKGADNSPVSEADLAVDAFLKTHLPALAPDAGWLSEETEDDPAARASDTAWIVDPIDGTRAFITQRHDWSICAALVASGRPLLAAIYAPVTDEMFIAAAGHGATLNGTAMRASTGAAITGARLAGPKRYLDSLAVLSADTQPQPKVFSLALRLTRVATGAFDIALSSPGSHDWDLAAADLLVHEAGGIMTNIAGNTLRYNQRETTHGALVATNTERHGPILGLISGRETEFA